MFLRRVTDHVRKQNWTAIAIDFCIVVLGVFLGIQVSNWNAAQAGKARELLLLGELRAELVESIDQLTIKRNAFTQVARSGERSIAFLDAGGLCGDTCWATLVDFFHASQWQQVIVGRSTYDEMRRNGWPRNRDVVDAVEDYHRQSDQVAASVKEPPAYRSLVRGLIPLAAHQPYWTNCFELADGEEIYLEQCPADVSPEVSSAGVALIVANPQIHAALTEWAGFTTGLDTAIAGQIDSAERAIAVIDEELRARRQTFADGHRTRNHCRSLRPLGLPAWMSRDAVYFDRWPRRLRQTLTGSQR
jgi:hypothetical protein